MPDACAVGRRESEFYCSHPKLSIYGVRSFASALTICVIAHEWSRQDNIGGIKGAFTMPQFRDEPGKRKDKDICLVCARRGK